MSFGWFGKKKEEARIDFSVKDLKEGFLLDYDMKTWQVSGHHRYVWEDGSTTIEWILNSADDTLFLEASEDNLWIVSRTYPRSQLDNMVYEYIEEYGKAPTTVQWKGVGYHLDEDSAAEFFANGEGPAKPLMTFDYEDEDEDHILTIEQWDDHSFTVSHGVYEEEYRFTNILPGEKV